MRSFLAAALLVTRVTAYVAPTPQRTRPALRASAFKDNLGREVSEERIEMLKKMGYVYDEERGSWTKPPRGRPRRRPALARALSARILEVRIADEASDTEAQAAREFRFLIGRNRVCWLPNEQGTCHLDDARAGVHHAFGQFDESQCDTSRA